MFVTFGLTVFAWIFFRADNVSHAFDIISEIMSSSLFIQPDYVGRSNSYFVLRIVGLFMLIEWLGREGRFAIENIGNKVPLILQLGFYYVIIFAIFWLKTAEQEFIYFQF